MRGVFNITYLGFVDVKFDNDKDLAKFYETNDLGDLELYHNQYVLIKDKNDDYIDRFRYDGENDKLVKFSVKNFKNDFTGIIKPKNYRQQCMFDLLNNDNIPVKLITGKQGSGKTYVCACYSLMRAFRREFNKIVYLRNNIQTKDSEQIGHLPNDLEAKLLPYLMPFVDAVGGMEGFSILKSRIDIEQVHLGHLRGRNFTNTIFLISEAQNLTKEHVGLIVGRINKGSILILEGDQSQWDKKTIKDNNGIVAMQEILKGNSLFGCIDLDKTERSKVSELSSLFFE